MKRTMLVFCIGALAWLSSACAPIYAGGGSLPSPHPHCAHYRVRVAGRWDAVTALRRGSMVRVVTWDGTILLGRLEHAGFDGIRFQGKASGLGVAKLDVMRVDVRDDTAAARGKRILAGAVAFTAALGAYEMFLGAVFGGTWTLPSARTLAVGAAGGAAYGATELALSRGWRRVYGSASRC